jgi:O-antigen ligase
VSESLTGAGSGGRRLELVGLGLLIGSVSAAVAAGGIWSAAAVGVSVCTLLVVLRLSEPAKHRVRAGYLAVEIPVMLLLLSTLVLRIRGTEDIAENPLDPAGLFRVGCLGLGLLLGTIALLMPEQPSGANIRSRPFGLYLLYVLVVFLGVATSPFPPLTLFRGVDLMAGPLVLLGAIRAAGSGGLTRIESLLFWFQVVLVGSVWLGVAVFPSEAVQLVDSPIPWQVEGILPAIASNGVGFLGASITVWALGYLVSPREEARPRPWVLVSIAVFGVVTLIAAQYRTGYVALVVGLVLLLALRGRRVLAGVVLLVTAGALLWGPSLVREAEPVLLRGETPEVAGKLSSRISWWDQALPVWQESPWIGGGLLTATRFEVLAAIGHETTATIHSTWIEALVGTGVIGLALLGASFLVLWRRAIAEALRPTGRILPLLLLALLSVRAFTGSTFEIPGRSALIFLTLALVLRNPRHVRPDTAPRASAERA